MFFQNIIRTPQALINVLVKKNGSEAIPFFMMALYFQRFPNLQYKILSMILYFITILQLNIDILVARENLPRDHNNIPDEENSFIHLRRR